MRGLLLVPSCFSLIQPGASDRHLDQQIISAYFCLMVVMETSLKDLCSSCDTHVPHALINRSTQLRYDIFSWVPFSQKRGNIIDLMLFVLAV